MRYLVYFLVVANLAYFAWYQYSPKLKPEAGQAIPVPPGINSLVLLSERAAQPDQPSVAEIDVEQSGQIKTSARQTDAIIPPAEQRVSQEIPSVQESEPEPEPEPVVTEPERICQTVGPLLDKKDAGSLMAQLSGQGYQVNVRGGDVREPAGYWVYLPAMPAAEARRIVSDLDAHGMKDYFIGKKNHISLGIFSRREKAKVRLEQVKELGYDAILDQRYRTRVVYWLDIEEHQGQPLLGSEIWKKIQVQHTDIRVQRVSCE